MKKLLTLLLCLVLVASVAVFATACGDNGTSTGSTGSSDTAPQQQVTIVGVSAPASVGEWATNRGEQENEEMQFFKMTESYKVGDDNGFIFKPVVSCVAGKLPAPAPADLTFTYTLKVKEGEAFVDVDESTYLENVDTAACSFDFAEAAIGKTFTLTVTPNGLEAEKQNDSKYSASHTFEVIDGYNAYNAIDLAYISNYDLTMNITDRGHIQYGWKQFREDNGLTLDPNGINAIIMQCDIDLVKESFPGNFFYTKEEAVALGNAAYEGSVKDESGSSLYYRLVEDDESFAFIGNYYTLSVENMPYVYYGGTNEKIEFNQDGTVLRNSVVSHATLMRIEGVDAEDSTVSSALVKDVYLMGNSPKTSDQRVQGGLIFFKTQWTQAVMDNVISRCYFITAFGQRPKGYFHVSNLKCYDSFNSPFYNWACEDMTLDNCIVKDAGGPAVIVDAVKGEGVNSPKVIATNCDFNNPVTGEEAWFVMAKATSMIYMIKEIDQIPRMISAQIKQYTQAMGGDPSLVPTRTFIRKETVAGEEKTMMNMIAVVKDGGGSYGTDVAAYIEYNGRVLDYGKGQGSKSNSTNPAYNTVLATTLTQVAAGPAPVLETSAGSFVYFDGTTAVAPGEEYGIAMADMIKGDFLNIYYNSGSSFEGYIGVMFEYFAE